MSTVSLYIDSTGLSKVWKPYNVFIVLERMILCSPRLYLFHPKNLFCKIWQIKKMVFYFNICNLFLCKAEFSTSLPQSSASHDPSESWWFAAFFSSFSFCCLTLWKWYFFQDSLMNRKFNKQNLFNVFIKCIKTFNINLLWNSILTLCLNQGYSIKEVLSLKTHGQQLDFVILYRRKKYTEENKILNSKID